MPEIEITQAQLRGMIGLTVRYRGHTCCVIEVLEDGPSVVLEERGPAKALQEDQFGDPQRRVPRTFTVPILDEQRTGIHPEFLALDLVCD